MAHFFPPLWEQRRRRIADVLYAHKAQRVLELGCGEGNVLSFLTMPSDDDEHPLTHLYGVDISRDALDLAKQQLQPLRNDYSDLRVDPLTIALYCGDARTPVPGIEADSVVCTEVIEHVSEPEASEIAHTVFARYRPKLAVFTTPNAEFNVHFPNLKYGTPEATFRVDDHKFEWTRAQFEGWAGGIASEHGYTVEFAAIGTRMRNYDGPAHDVGGCTQMAVFYGKAGETGDGGLEIGGLPLDDPPTLHSAIEYPFFDQPRMSGRELFDVVLDSARYYIGNRPFGLDVLWGVLEVRQQFKRRRHLAEWVDASPQFFVPAGDRGSGGGSEPTPLFRLNQGALGEDSMQLH